MAFSGTLYSFGHNEYAKLGNGNSTDQKSPVQITSVTSVGEYATLSFDFTTDYNIWYLGKNNNYEMGLGNTCPNYFAIAQGNKIDELKRTDYLTVNSSVYDYPSSNSTTTEPATQPDISNYLIITAGYNNYGQRGLGNTQTNYFLRGIETNAVNFEIKKAKSSFTALYPEIIEGSYKANDLITYYYKIYYEYGNLTSDSTEIFTVLKYSANTNSYDKQYSKKSTKFDSSNYSNSKTILSELAQSEITSLKNYLDTFIGTVIIPDTIFYTYTATNGLTYKIKVVYSKVSGNSNEYTMKYKTYFETDNSYANLYSDKNHKIIPVNYKTYQNDLATCATTEINNLKVVLDKVVNIQIRIKESDTNSVRFMLYNSDIYTHNLKLGNSCYIGLVPENSVNASNIKMTVNNTRYALAKYYSIS